MTRTCTISKKCHKIWYLYILRERETHTERERERERERDRVIMKVKKHFHLKRFNISLLQLRFSVLIEI